MLIAAGLGAGTPANGLTLGEENRKVATPSGAQVGICIRTLSGKVLREENAGLNFIPAEPIFASRRLWHIQGVSAQTECSTETSTS